MQYRDRIETIKVIELAFATHRYLKAEFAKYNKNTKKVTKGGCFWIDNEQTEEFIEIPPGKTIMMASLGIKAHWLDKNTPIVVANEQDTKDAINAVDELTEIVTMQTLKGKNISNFIRSVVNAANEETTTPAQCGILAWVPETLEGHQKQQKLDEELYDFGLTSKDLGQPKDKLKLDITVMTSRYINQFDKTIITAHDNNGNVISFWTSKEFAEGTTYTITGKVKKCLNDEYMNNIRVTRLNYVKFYE